eukprot:7963718-Alexandrium_andersonii.AAC.1
MSASLVGSEMCIRDSAWKASPSRTATSGSGCGTRTCWRPRAGLRRRATCLLYTSDAADDM